MLNALILLLRFLGQFFVNLLQILHEALRKAHFSALISGTATWHRLIVLYLQSVDALEELLLVECTDVRLIR